MSDLTRRTFLNRTAAAASLAALPACSSTPTPRVPKRIRVLVAGVRAQGRRHVIAYLRHPGVDVVALADPDTAMLMQAGSMVARSGAAPHITQDALALLDNPAVRPGIDVVSIATPDHWHALLATRACEAGMHVFVETPVSHSIEEGAAMVAAAREHGGLVQASLDARTHPAVQDAVRFARSGALGRIRSVRAVCYLYRPSIGRVRGTVDPPPSVDFDIWTGPSEKVALRRRRLHTDWRFDWRTGNGELGEAGSELLDLARWVLGVAEHPGQVARWPDRVWTCGGRFGEPDDGETPNTLLAVLDFDGIPVTFDQRGMPARFGVGTRMDRHRGISYGLVVEGEDRVLTIEPQRASAAVFDSDGGIVREFRGKGSAIGDFLAAVQGRRELSADIELGRSAADLGHLIGIAHRTGAPATRLDVLRSAFHDGPLTADIDAMDQHVARNGFDIDREATLLSGWQAVDRFTGEIHGNDAANALRRRVYRKPFALRGETERSRPRPRVG